MSRLRSVVDTTASVATIVAAGVLVWVVIGNRSRTAEISAAMAARGKQPPAVETKVTTAAEMTKHHDGARVAIVEFSDFECPYCGQYARSTYPRVQKELVDTGLADYVFRQFPLESIHHQAFKASEAVRCAASAGKQWEMHDALFADQKKIAEPDLVARATTLGLDRAAFQSCLSGQVAADVRADIDEGKRLGVNGTPTLFVGRIGKDGQIELSKRISGASSFADIEALVKGLQQPAQAN